MRERPSSVTVLPKRRKAKTASSDFSKDTDERYRLLIEAIAEGVYEWTLTPNTLELSTTLTGMFGFKAGELTSESWAERVHPDDRVHYRDATIAYFKGPGRRFCCEYRIRNKRNEWRWVSDRATSIRDSDGRVLRLIGTIADISESKDRETQLREMLQQQATTAEVLKAISRSAFDLQSVLDTLVESATRLCEADHAWLFQRDGEVLRFAASFGHGTEVHARIRDYFFSREVPIDRTSISGRSALEGCVVHVTDVLADPEYTWGGAQQIGGYRAALGAPLLRDGKVVGVIFIAKTMPQPFTSKHIELVSTFADQAVIAIENVRLFDEVQARTRDLAESLEQQTATAEVLSVISSSSGDLSKVFD